MADRESRRRTRGRHPSRASGPTRADPHAPQRWRERRWVARLIRLVVFVTPVVVAFVVALLLSRSLGLPDPMWARVLRWLLIAAVATVVMFVVERLLRRLLPLAALFSLTLVFPDETPSRFGLALRSMSARHLRQHLKHAADDQTEVDHAPREAAEHLLTTVAALSQHDRLTRGHAERVRAYAIVIGEEMKLPPEEIDRLRWAALVHDVGKIRVPAEILNKPGELTRDEYDIVKRHTTEGRELVAPLAGWLGDAAGAAYEHHERYAGGGYPLGVPASELPLCSRIVAVADAFDVMTSARSYKEPSSAATARAELERCAGTHFDPDVVRAMMGVSLGTLWKAMGPATWISQLGLFPRPLAQAGPTATTAVSAVAAVLTATIASFVPFDRSEPLVAQAPVVTTTTTTTTTVPSTTIAPVVAPPPITTTTTTTSTTTTTTTVPPTTTVPVAPPPTTTTTTTTTVPPTTTTTTTTLPPQPRSFGLSSGGTGDQVSQAILELIEGAAPGNATIPNYDTDRNADPGLTLVSTVDVLFTADPAGLQTWRLPPIVADIPGAVSLTLWIAPAVATAAPLTARAGLFDCDEARTDCTRLSRSTPVWTPAADGFQPIGFDLTPDAGPVTVDVGRRLEVRVAVPDAGQDIWIAYDAVTAPAALVIAP